MANTTCYLQIARMIEVYCIGNVRKKGQKKLLGSNANFENIGKATDSFISDIVCMGLANY